MIKLIILFRKPANLDAFEDRFAGHVQLMNQLPNLKRTVVNRAIGAPRGEPPYYLIHEIFFADLPAATYALNTPEGRTAGADLMEFARETSTLMFAEVWGEDIVPAAPPAGPAEAAAAAVAEIASAAQLARPATIEDIIAMNTPPATTKTIEDIIAMNTPPATAKTADEITPPATYETRLEAEGLVEEVEQVEMIEEVKVVEALEATVESAPIAAAVVADTPDAITEAEPEQPVLGETLKS